MAAHSADRQSGGGEEGATILLFYLAHSAYINKQLGLIPKHKNADGGLASGGCGSYNVCIPGEG